ncbi:MAG TPA: hypothetical protein VEJ47_01710 [Candidatus Eremiobacteraceae bacterium]|nr:hypothetical protein [Candidatus Eremiobacteraceae bacterium]
MEKCGGDESGGDVHEAAYGACPEDGARGAGPLVCTLGKDRVYRDASGAYRARLVEVIH